MSELSLTQFQLVWNLFSFMVAALGVAVAFFVFMRGEVAPRYRLFMLVQILLLAVAAYSYERLFQSWNLAFHVVDGAVRSTGMPFGEGLRFTDWIITVPLLMVVLVLALDLPSRQAWTRSIFLGLQGIEMLVLGYPGQMSSDVTTRWIWLGISMVPLLIIVYQLYFGLGQAIRKQPDNVRGLLRWARAVLVFSWSFYPIIYVLPLLGVSGSSAYVVMQAGYAFADLMAKPVFGALLLMAVMRKSAAEQSATAVEGGTPNVRALRASANVG